jgi:hypothetical protein
MADSEGDIDYLMDKYDNKPETSELWFESKSSGGLSLHISFNDGRENLLYRITLNNSMPNPGPPPENDPIYQMLVDMYPFLQNPEQRANIIGKVQSGKSFVIMAICWCAIYRWGLRPFMFALNNVDSYSQLIIRDYRDFNKWLGNHGETRRRLGINGLRGPNGQYNECPYVITLAMNNKSQLIKIRNQTHPYLIVGDEGDTLIKHCDPALDRTVTGHLFHSFLQNARSTWMVTATPFALLNQKGTICRTFELSQNTTYRGLDKFKINLLNKDEVKSLKKDNQLLESVVQRAIEVCHVEGRQPYSTILINTRYKKVEHIAIARHLQGHGLSSFVINGDGIFHYKIDGSVEKLKFRRVSALFDYFEDHAETYQTHLIIAKRVANRAVSFRPSLGRGTGGLIGEILLPSNNGCSRIQELRLCGKYSIDYPELQLFVSAEDFQKIHDELEHNYPKLIEANSSYGEAREQIEGQQLIDTGLHDRRAVDDTSLEDKEKYIEHEFATKQECLDFVTGKYTSYRMMTEETFFTTVALSDQQQQTWQRALEITGNWKREQDQIRLYCETTSGTWNPTVRKTPHGFNVAWNTERWETCHMMTSRFKNTSNVRYCSQYLAGPNHDYSRMNIVRWKDGFFEPDDTAGIRPTERSMDFEDMFPENVAFLYLTTRGSWRYFSRSDTRKMGVLTHSN